MKPAASTRIVGAADWAATLARWLLGALFVYMGLQKAVDPVAFLKLVREYHLVETPFLLNAIAVVLPWFEVFCGLLLLTGTAVRGTALVSLLMLLPFTSLIYWRARALGTAQSIPLCGVKFDCGCGQGEVWVCYKLVENSILILLAAGLLAGHGRRLCVRYSLLGERPRCTPGSPNPRE
jgi:uncharacterized membrane protein YphA (DoxX/SURF4 family)